MNTVKTDRKILLVAQQLFAEQGYDNTGIDEISTKAGVTKSLIYYYFKSKEEILNTIIQNALNDIVAYKTSKAADAADADQIIKDIISMLFGFWDEHEDTARILLMESLKKGKSAPLLSFWQASMSVPNDTVKSAYQIDNKQDLLLTFFFLLFLPTMFYTTLKHEWDTFTGRNTNETNKMEQMITLVCKTLLKDI